jgi:hypothetical protein
MMNSESRKRREEQQSDHAKTVKLTDQQIQVALDALWDLKTLIEKVNGDFKSVDEVCFELWKALNNAENL